MASSVRATQSHMTMPAARIGAAAAVARTAPVISGGVLAALVSDQIIPRLMLAHGVDQAATAKAALADFDLAMFVPNTLDCDARSLLIQLDMLIDRGVSIDAIMVEILAPAARILGEWWVEDRCDFIEVTMGLWRLQEVVRELAMRMPATPVFPERGQIRAALFAAFPGDQHDFGTVMIGELFRRHGWDSEILLGADMPDLLAEVSREHYDLVGLTVSCDCHRSRVPSAILAIRSVSRNPRIRVMVGGRVFVEEPAFAVQCGADATAPDARQALAVAEALVDAVAGEFAPCS